MDSRFKNIDSELNFKLDQSQLDGFFSEIDDISLDNAFIEASQKMQYPYAPAFWNQFTEAEPQIIQNVYFSEAAKNYSAAYNPLFWTAAEEALVQEGLNYQHKSTYWAEAEKLLVAADRTVFFRKWLTIASSLLLISLVGQFFLNDNKLELTESTELSQNNNALNNSFENGKNSTVVNYNTDTKEDANSSNKSPNSSTNKPNREKLNTSYNQNKTLNSNTKSSVKQIQDKVKLNNTNLAISTEETNTTNTEPLFSETNIKNDKEKHIENSNFVISEEESLESRKKEKRELLPTISKISLAQPLLLDQPNNSVSLKRMRKVEIIQKEIKNIPQIFISTQSGIGNSINTDDIINARIGLDLGMAFNLKNKKNFNITFLSGFEYQNLNGYRFYEDVTNHRRTGHISQVQEAYEFKDLIKWGNGVMFGYQAFKRFNLKFGAATDIFVGSRIKMYEQTSDLLTISEYNWGRNDFIHDIDFQLLSQLECILKNRLSITATGKFGLRNQIQTTEYSPILLPVKNRSVLIGFKYRLF